MGNVLCSVKVSFKHEAEAHGVAAHGGRVHRGPERVLKERGGNTDTEQCLSCYMELETKGPRLERAGFRNLLFLLEVLNSQYPENVNVLYVINWGWEVIEIVGGV